MKKLFIEMKKENSFLDGFSISISYEQIMNGMLTYCEIAQSKLRNKQKSSIFDKESPRWQKNSLRN